MTGRSSAASGGGVDRDGHPAGEALSAYVDGEIDPASRVEVERHVRACAACRAEVNEFRNASDLFRRVPTHRAPLSLRRDLYHRIDEHERRRRFFPFGIPLPSANVLGLAVTALLVAIMAPQVAGIWLAMGRLGHDVERAAPLQALPLAPTAASAETEAIPNEPAPAGGPPPPAATEPAPTSAPPTPTPSAPAVAASPTAVPVAATRVPEPGTSASPGAPPGAAAAIARPTQVPTQVPTAQPTATITTIMTRTIAGQVTHVNKAQRQLTVQTGPSAEGGARSWNVLLTEGTLVTFKDGRKLQSDDVGFADYIEVSGFEIGTGPIQAAAVKVTQSAVQHIQARPKVLVLLDGAGNLRAPQFGFTGDWIKRLNDTGYDVTAVDPVTIANGSANLKDFHLIAIGYPATLSNAAIQSVKASKLPVLNAEPRLVQALGLGLNVDPMQPTRMVSGKSIDIAADASPLTRGFSGETAVGGEQLLYRTPIVSNGTVLGTIADGVQRRAVWSLSGNVMYYGFWYSADGRNHNTAYWTLFDRSVLLLLGKDPLAAPPGTGR